MTSGIADHEPTGEDSSEEEPDLGSFLGLDSLVVTGSASTSQQSDAISGIADYAHTHEDLFTESATVAPAVQQPHSDGQASFTEDEPVAPAVQQPHNDGQKSYTKNESRSRRPAAAQCRPRIIYGW